MIGPRRRSISKSLKGEPFGRPRLAAVDAWILCYCRRVLVFRPSPCRRWSDQWPGSGYLSCVSPAPFGSVKLAVIRVSSGSTAGSRANAGMSSGSFSRAMPVPTGGPSRPRPMRCSARPPPRPTGQATAPAIPHLRLEVAMVESVAELRAKTKPSAGWPRWFAKLKLLHYRATSCWFMARSKIPTLRLPRRPEV